MSAVLEPQVRDHDRALTRSTWRAVGVLGLREGRRMLVPATRILGAKHAADGDGRLIGVCRNLRGQHARTEQQRMKSEHGSCSFTTSNTTLVVPETAQTGR